MGGVPEAQVLHQLLLLPDKDVHVVHGRQELEQGLVVLYLLVAGVEVSIEAFPRLLDGGPPLEALLVRLEVVVGVQVGRRLQERLDALVVVLYHRLQPGLTLDRVVQLLQQVNIAFYSFVQFLKGHKMV